MNWDLILMTVAQWLVSAYIVGSAIQYVKTDWLPNAPTIVWKIANPAVALGVAWLWYYDKAIPQIVFNAMGVLVTTFLYYTAILKKLQPKLQEGS